MAYIGISLKTLTLFEALLVYIHFNDDVKGQGNVYDILLQVQRLLFVITLAAESKDASEKARRDLGSMSLITDLPDEWHGSELLDDVMYIFDRTVPATTRYVLRGKMPLRNALAVRQMMYASAERQHSAAQRYAAYIEDLDAFCAMDRQEFFGEDLCAVLQASSEISPNYKEQ
jgi:hypothetical protein